MRSFELCLNLDNPGRTFTFQIITTTSMKVIVHCSSFWQSFVCKYHLFVMTICSTASRTYFECIFEPESNSWDILGRKINRWYPWCQDTAKLRNVLLREWQHNLRRIVQSRWRNVKVDLKKLWYVLDYFNFFKHPVSFN